MPGRRGLRPLGHPRLHLLERAAATFLAPSFGRCNGHLNQDLPACGGAEGVAGPIPGALGNRDLVVVVGVAPVNLAGLNIGDPVPGRGYGHPSRECRSEAITPATGGTNPAEVAPKRSERHTGALAFKHFAVSGNLIPSG